MLKWGCLPWPQVRPGMKARQMCVQEVFSLCYSTTSQLVHLPFPRGLIVYEIFYTISYPIHAHGIMKLLLNRYLLNFSHTTNFTFVCRWFWFERPSCFNITFQALLQSHSTEQSWCFEATQISFISCQVCQLWHCFSLLVII